METPKSEVRLDPLQPFRRSSIRRVDLLVQDAEARRVAIAWGGNAGAMEAPAVGGEIGWGNEAWDRLWSAHEPDLEQLAERAGLMTGRVARVFGVLRANRLVFLDGTLDAIAACQVRGVPCFRAAVEHERAANSSRRAASAGWSAIARRMRRGTRCPSDTCGKARRASRARSRASRCSSASRASSTARMKGPADPGPMPAATSYSRRFSSVNGAASPATAARSSTFSEPGTSRA